MPKTLPDEPHTMETENTKLILIHLLWARVANNNKSHKDTHARTHTDTHARMCADLEKETG